MEENKEEIGGGTLDSEPTEFANPSSLEAALKKEKTITLEDFKDTVQDKFNCVADLLTTTQMQIQMLQLSLKRLERRVNAIDPKDAKTSPKEAKQDLEELMQILNAARAVEDSHKSEQIKSDKENAERKDSQSAE